MYMVLQQLVQSYKVNIVSNMPTPISREDFLSFPPIQDPIAAPGGSIFSLCSARLHVYHAALKIDAALLLDVMHVRAGRRSGIGVSSTR